MDDPVILNIPSWEREKIRDLNRRVASVFVDQGVEDPRVAFTVLLNVLGSLIGTQVKDLDRVDYINKAQMMLPMYVEAYRVKEKKL